MFKLTHPLPEKYWVAVSGGVDSMAALNWLYKPSRANSLMGVLHVNHNTGRFADEANLLVRSFCRGRNIALKETRLEDAPPAGASKEEFWRDMRYEFFDTVSEPVILAHNLDDCLEEYIMCTMVRGYTSTIPYSRGHCVRPFRLWRRADIESYAKRHGVTYVNDPSNDDTNYKRNFIRHSVVPDIIKLNPGVYNIVERLILNEQSVSC